jgi:hypothetical protein
MKSIFRFTKHLWSWIYDNILYPDYDDVGPNYYDEHRRNDYY